MTDDEISRIFDMEKLEPYLKGPARKIAEAVAAEAKNEIGWIRDTIAKQEEKAKDADEQYRELSGERAGKKPLDEKEAAHLVLKERMEKLVSACWIVDTVSHPAGKCQYCDDERMILLTAPDGQTVRVPCDCRTASVKSYRAVKAHVKPESLMAAKLYRLGHENDPNEDGRYVRFENIDRMHPETVRDLMNSAYTSCSLAREAILSLALPLEESPYRKQEAE